MSEREHWSKQLNDGLAAMGGEPSALNAGQRGLLLDYLVLLMRWNEAFNLTAVRDQRQLVSRHLLDSLAALPWVKGDTLLDVGTGAGLPGIPLAIARPDTRVTLLDSNGKKTRFCRQAVMELPLPNVEVVQARVESWRSDVGFDTIISRAFTELNRFVAVTGPLLARGGRCLAMVGQAPTELPVAARVDVLPVEVPGIGGARHLVVIEP